MKKDKRKDRRSIDLDDFSYQQHQERKHAKRWAKRHRKWDLQSYDDPSRL